MKYRVLLHKTEAGYVAICPGLPDSKAQGATAEEALENVRYEISGSVSEREGRFWQDGDEDERLEEVEVAVGGRFDVGSGGSSARYPICVIKHSEGYAVSCPMLPGCFSQGNTMDEALSNIQIAIREWLISAQEVLLLGKPDIEVIEKDDEDQDAA
ncbi:UPF0150 protein Ta0767 [Geodia barretti]|uniref:UPF0150 protein Ta0767 n=1 Tax=Geodia barretti TaxID=519541 RepID=A0AA35R5N7_GEOBA|nr:UPF0150 protein Ta0767 [Geodia barretti]